MLTEKKIPLLFVHGRQILLVYIWLNSIEMLSSSLETKLDILPRGAYLLEERLTWQYLLQWVLFVQEDKIIWSGTHT